MSITATGVTTIDYDEALALLERAVEEKGEDYVYFRPNGISCVYTFEGEPSCILGHALGYKGVVISEQRGILYLNDNIIGAIADDLQVRYGVALTPDALLLWEKAQKAQDEGATWGRALVEAKNAVAEAERDPVPAF